MGRTNAACRTLRTGATGATGSSTTGGAVETFISTANVSNNQCIGNITFTLNTHATCLAGQSGYLVEASLLTGPMPSAGGSPSSITAFVETAPGAGQSYTVAVLDATPATATVLASCTVASGTTSCGATTVSGTASAGDYLEVRITNVGGAANRAWRVSFRY